MSGACSTHDKDDKFIKFLLRKPEAKGTFGDLVVNGG
jgi:hypothetical protein